MKKRLAQLQSDRSHKAKCAEDIMDRASKEARILNVDEQKMFDELLNEVESLNNEIVSVTETIKRQDQLEALQNSLKNGPGRQITPDPVVPATARDSVYTAPEWGYENHSLKAFTGRDAELRAYRSGQWLRAQFFNDHRAAYWCENHGVGIQNAIGTTSNPAAGVLVPQEFSSAIITLREQYGVFRRNARVIPMGRDSMVVPRYVSGMTVSFLGENPASGATATDPAFNQVQLTAKKLGGLAKYSTEIAEDAVIQLADWLAKEFAYQFALKEDQCGFLGTGSATYGGINGLGNIFLASSSLAGAVDAASSHDTFAEIDYADLQTVMSKLPEYARANAKWYCSTVALDLVFGRIMANAGGNTIQNMMGGYGPSYMGYPIVISQVLPTATTDLSDVPMLYFGDLAMAATLGDRREIRVLPSEHRYLEFDQVAIFATERFDINVHDYGTTTAAGPIVALVGE